MLRLTNGSRAAWFGALQKNEHPAVFFFAAQMEVPFRPPVTLCFLMQCVPLSATCRHFPFAAMAALPLVNDWVAQLQGSKPVCACCHVAISLHKLRWLEGIVMGYHRPCGRPIFYMGRNAQATDENGTEYFPCCAECCHEHKEQAASVGYRLRSL